MARTNTNTPGGPGVDPSIGGPITGGTTGSVLFVAPGSLFGQDNSNFFWDNSNNRLGLGTNSPATILDIAGAGDTGAAQFRSGQSAAVSAANTGRIRYNATSQTFQVSENGGAYQNLSSGGTVNGTGAAGQAAFWTGVSDITGDDQFYWNDTDKTFSIGEPTDAVGILGLTTKASIRYDDANSAASVLSGMMIEASGNKQPYFVFGKSRGDLTAKTIVDTGDTLCNLVSLAYDGTTYVISSLLTSTVEGTPSVGVVDTNFTLNVTGGGVATPALYADPSGRIGFGSTTIPLGVRMYTLTSGGPSQIYFESPDDTANQIAFLRGSGLSYFGPTGSNDFHIYGGTTSSLAAIPIVIHPGTNETVRFVNDVDRSMEFIGGLQATIVVGRSTVAPDTGSDLVAKAGGATIGATDKNGGTLVLSSGISTGTGVAGIEFRTTQADATGTADNTPELRGTIDGDGKLEINAGKAASGQMMSVGGVLNINFTPVGNVTTGEDDLMSYVLPANVLGTNGDTIEIETWGTFANNGNTKVIKVYFGATPVSFSIAGSGGGTNYWKISSVITRTASGTQVMQATLFGDPGFIPQAIYLGVASPTETLSGAVTIKLTGEATDTDDIIQNNMIIKFVPNN